MSVKTLKHSGGSMGTIVWETDMQTALKKARADKKPVMADFFNPG